MAIAEDMALLAQLLRCGDDICLWSYDAQGRVLSGNSPEAAMMDTAFELFDCKRLMLDYGRKHSAPITVGTSFGLRWSAAFEKEDGALVRAWVIGPFFYQSVTARALEQGLRYYENLDSSPAWRRRFAEAAQGLPIVLNTLMARYTLMLHYCATQEHLEISDIYNPLPPHSRAAAPGDVLADGSSEGFHDSYGDKAEPAGDGSGNGAVSAAPGAAGSGEFHDRHKVWQAEQALLQMVRTGDRDYREALSESMSISSGVPLQSNEALRQGKTSVIVFTTLVTRAAMEGGLSPDVAYPLGDSYIQSAESARTMSELDALSVGMYDDFICRVHRQRIGPEFSPEIRRCVDYLDMHLSEKIHAADLARLVGYNEYYLTRKFQKETGLSLSEYIKFARVERAKGLLRDTDLTAQEIADRLGFSSRNYFSRIFKEVTGVIPTAYREMRQ